MKNIVVDTCVFINVVKESAAGMRCIEQLERYDEPVNIIVSVVTMAELKSFIGQNGWGKPKIEKLNSLLEQIVIVDISNADQILIDAYSYIDAYSKRKAKDKSGTLLDSSAKKMGKNDLWIAATAYSLDVPLLTTDGDFDHLNQTIMDIVKIV